LAYQPLRILSANKAKIFKSERNLKLAFTSIGFFQLQIAT